MARAGYPSDKLDQFVLRLPDGLRDALKKAAKRNERSMNAEILARIADDPRTLRDDIAIAALTGLLATAPAMKGDTADEAIALACYRMADLLLAERAKVRP